ncbi:hypothetical protein ANN_06130 [Periplaneta americana]|uniref:Uncharacterized protein n=1 Tax=Periplaneta americana TaxID=6978 RepID=A0ABQ8TDL3_PERAM|nr:hypothetical protein ANN_06130 [Periplaneta americana]
MTGLREGGNKPPGSLKAIPLVVHHTATTGKIVPGPGAAERTGTASCNNKNRQVGIMTTCPLRWLKGLSKETVSLYYGWPATGQTEAVTAKLSWRRIRLEGKKEHKWGDILMALGRKRTHQRPS